MVHGDTITRVHMICLGNSDPVVDNMLGGTRRGSESLLQILAGGVLGEVSH